MDLDALLAEHDELWKTPVGTEAVYWRRPTRTEFRRLKQEAAQPQKVVDADENLARSVIVGKTQAEVAALFERYPGAAAKICVDAVAIATGDEIEEGKRVTASLRKLEAETSL